MQRAAGVADGFPRVIEHTLKEAFVVWRQPVRVFGFLALRKDRVDIEVTPNVSTATLHEMRRQTATVRLILSTRQSSGRLAKSACSMLSSERKAASLPLCGVAVTRMTWRSGCVASCDTS